MKIKQIRMRRLETLRQNEFGYVQMTDDWHKIRHPQQQQCAAICACAICLRLRLRAGLPIFN